MVPLLTIPPPMRPKPVRLPADAVTAGVGDTGAFRALDGDGGMCVASVMMAGRSVRMVMASPSKAARLKRSLSSGLDALGGAAHTPTTQQAHN